MPEFAKARVAIVAALEREVRPLVRDWRACVHEYAGRKFRIVENGDVVLVCGGIGAEAARRAAEAVIALYAPAVVYSAGFAGSLIPAYKVADILEPQKVVNAGNGSSVSLEGGEGVLVSLGAVASPEQKARLRDAFGAQAVDMEAAAVAQAAEARGVSFRAVKVISDESDFVLPAMEQFVNSSGEFLEMRFALFTIVRPWLWLRVFRLARHSGRASRALSAWLREMIANELSHSAPARLEAVDRR